MKRLWIAVGIFTVIITLCVTAFYHQRRQIQALLTELDGVVAAFDSDNLENAHGLAVALAEDFEHRTRLVPYFMSHGDLNNCHESVLLLAAILEDNDAEEFRMESARCRAQLTQLLKKESPTLKNIL